MTRQRGVTVELLDYDKLTAACRANKLAPLSYSGNALLRRENEEVYVIVSYEGVGDTKLRPGMVSLDTMSHEWEFLPLQAALECRTGVTKDLADHIRTFGDRLNANHWSWYEWAKGARR